MDHPKANRIVLQEIRQFFPCRLCILVYNLVADNLREGVSPTALYHQGRFSRTPLTPDELSRAAEQVGRLQSLTHVAR